MQLNLAARHCPILVEARERYLNRMFPGFSFGRPEDKPSADAAEDRATIGNSLRGMKIELAEASVNQYNCENSPYLGMNETCKYAKYELPQPCRKYFLKSEERELTRGSNFPDELVVHSLNSDARYISSVSVWGVLRGMETFSQAIFLKNFLNLKKNSFPTVVSTSTGDRCRYARFFSS